MLLWDDNLVVTISATMVSLFFIFYSLTCFLCVNCLQGKSLWIVDHEIGGGESNHSQLLGIVPDFNLWSFSHKMSDDSFCIRNVVNDKFNKIQFIQYIYLHKINKQHALEFFR